MLFGDVWEHPGLSTRDRSLITVATLVALMQTATSLPVFLVGLPAGAMTPDAEDGPVLITVEYRVPAERASDFIETMDEMRTFRRREGAISWGLFRDAADPDHYVETFRGARMNVSVTLGEKAHCR